jgi:DNA-binding transcriptional ArsR family regulator
MSNYVPEIVRPAALADAPEVAARADALPARETAPARAASSRAIPHPSAAQLELSTILRTCGEPIRLELIRTLADAGAELRSGELTGAVGLPTSTCSYHLKLLRQAGVTRTRAAGTERYISLRRDDLDARFPGLVDVLLRG